MWSVSEEREGLHSNSKPGLACIPLLQETPVSFQKGVCYLIVMFSCNSHVLLISQRIYNIALLLHPFLFLFDDVLHSL